MSSTYWKSLLSKPEIAIFSIRSKLSEKAGNAWLFIVVDHSSKFMFLKAMKKAKSQNIVKFLVQEIFHKFGTPEIIHMENGDQFVNAEFSTTIDNYKITNMKTVIYSPQSNASEIVNQQVLSTIRAYLHKDQRNWGTFCPRLNAT